MPPVATHAVSQRKGVRKGVERRVRKKVRGVVMQRPVRIKPDLQRHPSAARASSSASLVNRRQSFLMALLSTGSSSAVVVPILAIPMQRISSLTLHFVLELPVKLPNFPTDFPNMENGHPTRSSYKDGTVEFHRSQNKETTPLCCIREFRAAFPVEFRNEANPF